MIQVRKDLRPLGVERITIRERRAWSFETGVVVGALLACAGVLLFGLWGMR